MPDVVTRADCSNTHADLDKAVETAIGTAAASVEARIKVWILTTAVALLGVLVYFLIELGSYRERVDNNNRRIDRVEQIIERRAP